MSDLEREQERLFSNYTMIRNGLRDHIQGGMFSPFTLGVYAFLQLYASFESSINWTNAQAVATTFSSGVSHRSVQDAFYTLRQNKYIDYPVGGAGKGQTFPVLIMKGQPTDGVLKGSTLIGKQTNDFETIIYEFPDAKRAYGVLKSWEGTYFDRAHDRCCPCASCAQAVRCGVPLQDIRLRRPLKPVRLEEGEEGTASAPTSLSAMSSGHGD